MHDRESSPAVSSITTFVSSIITSCHQRRHHTIANHGANLAQKEARDVKANRFLEAGVEKGQPLKYPRVSHATQWVIGPLWRLPRRVDLRNLIDNDVRCSDKRKSGETAA